MADNADGPIGLAEFLTDLRAELSEAQARASGDALKLGVEEVTLSLDVVHTISKAGEVTGGVKAKFWVFASAEAAAKGTASSERARTHHLTLTLKPRMEEVIVDHEGRQTTITRSVDVTGALDEAEEQPELPNLPQSHHGDAR